MMNKSIHAKLEPMFRTCHAIGKHNRPLFDFNWLCKLDESKGVQLGETYRNRVKATEFIHFIAMTAFNQVAANVNRSKFVCIIGDDITDISVKEQSLWFVRTCIQGVISVHFMGGVGLEKADAEYIVNAIKAIVGTNLDIRWPDFVSRMVASSTDGASVMLGVRSGVASRLMAVQPALLSMWCLNHRLELSLKDASEQLVLYVKAISTLGMGLYYFYKKSPLNRTNLKCAAVAFLSSENIPVAGIDTMTRQERSIIRECSQTTPQETSVTVTEKKVTVLMPSRMDGTRWMGHVKRRLTNISKSYGFIVLHLQQSDCATSSTAKSKSKAFLKLLTSRSVVCFIYFMHLPLYQMICRIVTVFWGKSTRRLSWLW